MEAFEQARRLPALASLRSAWRSESKARDEGGANVEIEVVDVSAQLVQNNQESVSNGGDNLGGQTDDSGSGVGDLGAEREDRRDERNIHEIQETEWDKEDLFEEAPAASNKETSFQEVGPLPGIQEAVSLHAKTEVAPQANGHSKPYSRGRSPQRGAKSPNRVPPQSFDCQAKKPGLRSKTPPRLDCSLLKITPDLPLSPTQSLPAIKNGVYRNHSGLSNHRLHSLASEHIVDIPGNQNGVKCDSGRPIVSTGYMSESGQARPPPIKASSKKPPRCPTSHSGANGDSGHHIQHGRRRRDSGEQDKSKAKRGQSAGAARWKMKLVTAILLACFGVLLYFQVFYVRPQQLQAIMRSPAQKEVLGAGLVSSGTAASQERLHVELTRGFLRNETKAEAVLSRKLAWSESTGVEERWKSNDVGWMQLTLGSTAKKEQELGGFESGKGEKARKGWKDKSGQKELTGSGGQRHEREGEHGGGVETGKQSTRRLPALRGHR